MKYYQTSAKKTAASDAHTLCPDASDVASASCVSCASCVS